MNENLNLEEILKDCPKGTELYSTIFGEVKLDYVEIDSEYPIYVKTKDCLSKSFSSCGELYSDYDGECTLFPSREQRDWSKFNPKKEELVPPCEFKDGDILSYQNKYLNNRTIYIYRYHKTNNTAFYVALGGNENETFYIDNEGECALNGYDHTVRFATEEEKQKLFDTIKLNGYKWNAKTKTLRRLIKSKFDPKTLQPFDRVLVCNGDGDIWRCSIFSHIYGKDNLPSVCNGIGYKYCIPYNDNTKHLAGTTDKAPEFYRYWDVI